MARQGKSARRLLIVFAVSVFAPAIVLAVLAYGSVARERRALTAERAGALAAVGARIRRDLADALDGVRREEEERPWFHYNKLYFEPGQVGKGMNYQPSPLAMGNGNPLVDTWSHFQIDPAGEVSSPTPPEQVPAQSLQVRRNVRANDQTEEENDAQQVAAIADGLQQSNDVIEKVQDKLAPKARAWQAQVKKDGKGNFPGQTDNNLRQSTNRKGTLANLQSEETVRDIIEGKKERLQENGGRPEEEIVSVEVSGLNFEMLPDLGILAYRFVDAPNEANAYGGAPVLRYVQGFKLNFEYIRSTLFPALVDRELEIPGVAVALLPASTIPGGRIAYEEPVSLLPGHRIVVTDAEPEWVAERVARLSMLLIGAAALLLLVIAGGLTFTLRAVKQEVDLAGRKSDFVAAVTHELRTPLTGIKMYADMLKAGWVKDDSTRDEYVGFMAAETDRLARLVNRVLDFARTERGRAEVVPIDLSEPVREVVRDFGPYIREKGFVLSVRHETERRAMANVDAVKQVLLNLLENAVKYAAGAQEKRIEVAVSDAGDRIALDVIDRGPGVPAAEQERIFAEFYRPGEELTREAPGAGLGLALVRRLAESMGGAAQVRETPGGGATFRVTLRTE